MYTFKAVIEKKKKLPTTIKEINIYRYIITYLTSEWRC